MVCVCLKLHYSDSRTSLCPGFKISIGFRACRFIARSAKLELMDYWKYCFVCRTFKGSALWNNSPNGDFYWLRRTSWTSSDDWPWLALAPSGPLISLITFMMSVRSSHWGPHCEPWSITLVITNDNVITVKNSRSPGTNTYSEIIQICIWIHGHFIML